MDINLENKKIYEDAFIADGQYNINPTWKPDIDENQIEEWCEDAEFNQYPATPLGYRDYAVSRKEGIKNILLNVPTVTMSYEEASEIVCGKEPFRKYDHIIIDETDYVVVANDINYFYIVTEDNNLYGMDYKK